MRENEIDNSDQEKTESIPFNCDVAVGELIKMERDSSNGITLEVRQNIRKFTVDYANDTIDIAYWLNKLPELKAQAENNNDNKESIALLCRTYIKAVAEGITQRAKENFVNIPKSEWENIKINECPKKKILATFFQNTSAFLHDNLLLPDYWQQLHDFSAQTLQLKTKKNSLDEELKKVKKEIKAIEEKKKDEPINNDKLKNEPQEKLEQKKTLEQKLDKLNKEIDSLHEKGELFIQSINSDAFLAAGKELKGKITLAVDLGMQFIAERNYESLTALSGALQDSAIYNLIPFIDLSTETKQHLEQIKTITAASGSYKNQREKGKEKGATPYSGVPSSDLTFAHDGNYLPQIIYKIKREKEPNKKKEMLKKFLHDEIKKEENKSSKVDPNKATSANIEKKDQKEEKDALKEKYGQYLKDMDGESWQEKINGIIDEISSTTKFAKIVQEISEKQKELTSTLKIDNVLAKNLTNNIDALDSNSCDADELNRLNSKISSKIKQELIKEKIPSVTLQKIISDELKKSPKENALEILTTIQKLLNEEKTPQQAANEITKALGITGSLITKEQAEKIQCETIIFSKGRNNQFIATFFQQVFSLAQNKEPNINVIKAIISTIEDNNFNEALKLTNKFLAPKKFPYNATQLNDANDAILRAHKAYSNNKECVVPSSTNLGKDDPIEIVLENASKAQSSDADPKRINSLITLLRNKVETLNWNISYLQNQGELATIFGNETLKQLSNLKQKYAEYLEKFETLVAPQKENSPLPLPAPSSSSNNRPQKGNFSQNFMRRFSKMRESIGILKLPLLPNIFDEPRDPQLDKITEELDKSEKHITPAIIDNVFDEIKENLSIKQFDELSSLSYEQLTKKEEKIKNNIKVMNNIKEKIPEKLEEKLGYVSEKLKKIENKFNEGDEITKLTQLQERLKKIIQHKKNIDSVDEKLHDTLKIKQGVEACKNFSALQSLEDVPKESSKNLLEAYAKIKQIQSAQLPELFTKKDSTTNENLKKSLNNLTTEPNEKSLNDKKREIQKELLARIYKLNVNFSLVDCAEEAIQALKNAPNGGKDTNFSIEFNKILQNKTDPAKKELASLLQDIETAKEIIGGENLFLNGMSNYVNSVIDSVLYRQGSVQIRDLTQNTGNPTIADQIKTALQKRAHSVIAGMELWEKDSNIANSSLKQQITQIIQEQEQKIGKITTKLELQSWLYISARRLAKYAKTPTLGTYKEIMRFTDIAVWEARRPAIITYKENSDGSKQVIISDPVPVSRFTDNQILELLKIFDKNPPSWFLELSPKIRAYLEGEFRPFYITSNQGKNPYLIKDALHAFVAGKGWPPSFRALPFIANFVNNSIATSNENGNLLPSSQKDVLSSSTIDPFSIKGKHHEKGKNKIVEFFQGLFKKNRGEERKRVADLIMEQFLENALGEYIRKNPDKIHNGNIIKEATIMRAQFLSPLIVDGLLTRLGIPFDNNTKMYLLEKEIIEKFHGKPRIITFNGKKYHFNKINFYTTNIPLNEFRTGWKSLLLKDIHQDNLKTYVAVLKQLGGTFLVDNNGIINKEDVNLLNNISEQDFNKSATDPSNALVKYFERIKQKVRQKIESLPDENKGEKDKYLYFLANLRAFIATNAYDNYKNAKEDSNLCRATYLAEILSDEIVSFNCKSGKDRTGSGKVMLAANRECWQRYGHLIKPLWLYKKELDKEKALEARKHAIECIMNAFMNGHVKAEAAASAPGGDALKAASKILPKDVQKAIEEKYGKDYLKKREKTISSLNKPASLWNLWQQEYFIVGYIGFIFDTTKQLAKSVITAIKNLKKSSKEKIGEKTSKLDIQKKAAKKENQQAAILFALTAFVLGSFFGGPIAGSIAAAAVYGAMLVTGAKYNKSILVQKVQQKPSSKLNIEKTDNRGVGFDNKKLNIVFSSPEQNEKRDKDNIDNKLPPSQKELPPQEEKQEEKIVNISNSKEDTFDNENKDETEKQSNQFNLFSSTKMPEIKQQPTNLSPGTPSITVSCHKVTKLTQMTNFLGGKKTTSANSEIVQIKGKFDGKTMETAIMETAKEKNITVNKSIDNKGVVTYDLTNSSDGSKLGIDKLEFARETLNKYAALAQQKNNAAPKVFYDKSFIKKEVSHQKQEHNNNKGENETKENTNLSPQNN